MMRIWREILRYGFLSERLLRILKRKAAQVMTFRSDEGLEYLCDSLGVVASLRTQGGSLYDKVAAKFITGIKRPVSSI